MSTRAVRPVYSMAQLLIAALVMLWCVSYFYEDRQLDQCLKTFSEQATANQARSKADLARGQQLKARADEIAKGFAPTK